MNEKNRKSLVYLSLPIAIAWGAWNFMGKPGQEPTEEKPATIAPLTASNRADTLTAEEMPITAATAWEHDPFAQPAKASTGGHAESVTNNWNLTGVVYSKTDPLAIINNTFVRVGDQVDGATITQINKGDVQITYKGKPMTLYVNRG